MNEWMEKKMEEKLKKKGKLCMCVLTGIVSFLLNSISLAPHSSFYFLLFILTQKLMKHTFEEMSKYYKTILQWLQTIIIIKNNSIAKSKHMVRDSFANWWENIVWMFVLFSLLATSNGKLR